jgi:predicted Zn-ribbon and HTH transcriptional regulator
VVHDNMHRIHMELVIEEDDRRRYQVQQELRAGPQAPAENSVFENLSRVERDLNDVMGALALLGVKRCSQCRHFYRSADPGELIDCGEIVCYGCVPIWWPSQSGRLGIADRERTEGKLASWLRKYHRAEVRKMTPGKAPDDTDAEFQMVAKCLECAGSGKLMEGERCRFCNGLGTVRIVVAKE